MVLSDFLWRRHLPFQINSPKRLQRGLLFGLERDLGYRIPLIHSLKEFLVVSHNTVWGQRWRVGKLLMWRIWENYQHRRFQYRWGATGQDVTVPKTQFSKRKFWPALFPEVRWIFRFWQFSQILYTKSFPTHPQWPKLVMLFSLWNFLKKMYLNVSI